MTRGIDVPYSPPERDLGAHPSCIFFISAYF
jgi:hypothetical protein